MSVDLPPYPAIKDSAVAWLGEVPDHWTAERLKSSMHNIVEQTTERRAADLYVALEHVESWTGRLRHAGLDVSFDSQVKCFRSGDVLFGKLRPYLAKVTRPTSDGICVGEFLVLRPRHSNATAPYMEQLLRSKPIIDAVNRSTFGAKMPRADWQFMGGMAIALPPLPEQAAIVRFLDYADRRIRRYIRAQQQLIALLEEQKQALIHQAVTGQIDVRTGKPYPVYKDSRVEWLGRIPQRWRAVSLGRLTLDRCDGPFGSGLKSSHYTDEGIRVVRLQNIGHGTFNDEDAVYIAPEHYATLGDHSVQPGDLLIAGLGDPHHPAGRACVAPTNIRPAMVKADCFRFRVDQEAFLPAFAALQLTATAHAASAVLSTGATRQRTNLQSTTGRHVVVPSKSEQARVVEYCTGEKGRLDAVQQAAGREILLLGAYRTRLIADVVTGKLDVREAAARLPDEVEELEPLDEADALIDGEDEPTDALATAP